MFEKELESYPDLMNPYEIAQMCNCSENFIRNEIRRGNLKALKISRKFRVPKQYLIEYLMKSKV